jgi:hypothetical protein
MVDHGVALRRHLDPDPFLHRVDIARATGTPMTATAEHEGTIIDDVVAEWAGRHAARARANMGSWTQVE